MAEGCREVLNVAWRLAYAHWKQQLESPPGKDATAPRGAGESGPDAKGALALCDSIAVLVLEQLVRVSDECLRTLCICLCRGLAYLLVQFMNA